MSYLRIMGTGLLLMGLGAGLVSAQDETYTGHLDSQTPSVTYTFEMEVGGVVYISAEATSGDLDTSLALSDSNGEVVAENDDRGPGTFNSALGHIAEVSGTYTIAVSRYRHSDTSGNFLLSFLYGEAATNALAAMSNSARETLSGPELRRETEHFVIHYTVEGYDGVTEEYVDLVARALEDVWEIEIEQMGWPIPPADGLLGGDDRFDVYLLDLTDEWSGYALSGYTAPGRDAGDNPNTAVLERRATSSYLAIENDFAERTDISTRVADLVYATIAHEFHHVIQDGFDYRDPHAWYYEATAVWMQMMISPKDERSQMQLVYNFEYPELCFGTRQDPNFGQLVYGEWVFIQSLVETHGMDVVPNLWANIATLDGFAALQATLEKYDDTIPNAMARHRLQNLVRNYDQANFMGEAIVWMENRITSPGQWQFTGQGVQELGANYFGLALQPNNYHIGLVNDDSTLLLWAVGIRGTEADVIRLGRGGTVSTNGYDEMYLMVFNPNYDENLNDCSYSSYSLDIKPGSPQLAPVEAVWDASYFLPLR